MSFTESEGSGKRPEDIDRIIAESLEPQFEEGDERLTALGVYGERQKQYLPVFVALQNRYDKASPAEQIDIVTRVEALLVDDTLDGETVKGLRAFLAYVEKQK